jgi:hypothetical protein
MAMKQRIGTILLGIYLIMAGLVILIGLHFMYSPIIEGVLALAAGIFILLGR